MFSIFKIFKKKKIIPHIRLSGVIGAVGKFKQGLDFAGQQSVIDKAFSIKKASAVAITVNSPGGSPVQSHLIYSYIKKQAKKNKKKVLVFAEDVAASGGYLIACAGDEIYANSSSIIGSIGVIYSSFGMQELIKKVGIERRIYTAGKNKSTLDPFVEEKQEDIERLKKIQLELHSDFIKVVEESRSSKLKKDKNIELYTGEFWSGSTAKKLGLIDGIGNAEEIIKEKFGEDVVIKKYEKSKSWLNKKLSSSSENQIENVLNILEEKSIWQKYGF
jgi:signal peptide peptidase SppA